MKKIVIGLSVLVVLLILGVPAPFSRRMGYPVSFIGGRSWDHHSGYHGGHHRIFR